MQMRSPAPRRVSHGRTVGQGYEGNDLNRCSTEKRSSPRCCVVNGQREVLVVPMSASCTMTTASRLRLCEQRAQHSPVRLSSKFCFRRLPLLQITSISLETL